MKSCVRFIIVIAAFHLCLFAQQKPQWMPGQVGLNAGLLPSSGFTYTNITINYAADPFNGPNGNAIPVTGTYNV